MSEYTPVSEPVDAEFGDVLDDWISGASVSKRSVVVYGNPGLYAEYEQLEREYAAAAADEERAPGELAGGDVSRIEQAMADLYERWQQSKSTWTVRALAGEEVDAAKAQEPALVRPERPQAPLPPTAPKPLPAKHTDHDAKVFTVASQQYDLALKVFEADVRGFERDLEDYVTALANYQSELNIRLLALGVEKIEFADGRTATGVTADQLHRLRERAGDAQLTLVSRALTEAGTQETVIPAPFSRSTSGTDRT